MATLYSNNIVKRHLFGEAVSYPIRKIGLSDLREVLRLGWEDFQAMPSHAVVVCLIYPVLGLVLFRMVLGHSVLPLLFPLAAGFALIGPFAAIGLYELSRRRERGEEVEAWDAIKVLRAPSFGAMLELGVLLLVLFGVWIGVANAIYVAIFGHAAAASIPDFATRVLTTPEGWSLSSSSVAVSASCLPSRPYASASYRFH
ncbi:putative membrane protein [Bradyrhizobium sp. LM3.4]